MPLDRVTTLRAGLVLMSRPEYDALAREVDRPHGMIPAWRVRVLLDEIEAQSQSRAAILDTYAIRRRT